MIKRERSKNIALVIMTIAFFVFIYGTFKAIQIVHKTKTGTSEGIYTSYVSTSKEIEQKAYLLTKECKDTLCKVQHLLDFSSDIPYVTRTFQQNSPQKTIQKNFGDCDDKSNLLISMLYALKIEAYFVLVPKHIFVIVPLDDERLAHKKGLWINEKKYYILETTAKSSKIGFALKYKLNEINTIIEPFTNKKIKVKSLKYKL